MGTYCFMVFMIVRYQDLRDHPFSIVGSSAVFFLDPRPVEDGRTWGVNTAVRRLHCNLLLLCASCFFKIDTS